jgi:hypothetical protein
MLRNEIGAMTLRHLMINDLIDPLFVETLQVLAGVNGIEYYRAKHKGPLFLRK